MKKLNSTKEVTTATCSGVAAFGTVNPAFVLFLFNIMKIPFGKYKGTPVTEMRTAEEIDYLHWLSLQSFIAGDLRRAIIKHLTR
jgi:uncharacterized protein (DUF3820 family)